jgi:hypothetical protein
MTKNIINSLQDYFTNLDMKFLSRETLWEKRPVVIGVGNCDINYHGGTSRWRAMVCH